MPSSQLTRSASRCSLDAPKKRLPRLLQVLRCTGGKLLPNIVVTLPSNMAFRMTNYFKLLEAQRLAKECQEDERLETKQVINVDWQIETSNQPEAKRPRRSKLAQSDITWIAQDIVKAAKLLQSENQKILFEDEEEMRRVFTLLYDVFRYKTVMKEALDETGFSSNHPQYRDMSPLVWLLFYDLHKRRFLPREYEDEAVCRNAFLKMGLASIEDDLWSFRVRLAAALARNRIKNHALRLNLLLPNHLRDERLLSTERSPANGWINSFLIRKSEFIEELNKLGIRITEQISQSESTAKLDHVCPKVLSIPSSLRATMARSALVKAGRFILQDRTFCLGPTVIGQILKDLSLRGTVAQSHIISPRATAYLANVLQDNEKIDKLLAFGSGNKLHEYHEYLRSLGVQNCELRPEKFSDISPDSPLLENVMAVLATPPNSWTGVADPVDLVCSRNGDMSMLRALTQTRRDRDILLLEEQRDTLRYSMSLPQVQVVVYESHSMSSEENIGMVQSAVDCMNEWARQKHTDDQRIQQEQEEAEEKLNKSLLPGGTPAQREQREKEALEAQEALSAPIIVQVPPCDLFDILPLPHLCAHGQDCTSEEGCYIARIQRKEVIGLDAKYMIKIAEARGLFGSESGQKKASTARALKKREELERSQSGSDKCKVRRTKIEINRIAAHTHASLTRCSSSEILPCERYNTHALFCRKRRATIRRTLIRSWWHVTYQLVRRYIPYWQLTPRTQATTIMPLLRLPRSIQRQPFPLHRVHLPIDIKSEPGDMEVLNELPETRRNSC